MTVPAEPPSRARRSRRRTLLFVGVAAVLVLSMLELAGAVGYSLLTGELFTFSGAGVFRDRARAGVSFATAATKESRGDTVQWAASHGVMLHPFLGYVHDKPKVPSPEWPISSFGFNGDAPPLRTRSPDRFIVGVVGGSVALHFSLYARDSLVAALRRSPALADRSIEIVSLALGGYKQPQQLLTVQLLLALGGEFDCIINLDGYNEVALVEENVPLGVPGWYPRSWARLCDSMPSPEQLRRIGRIEHLTERRREAAVAADGWWWSPLSQFVWVWRDRRLDRDVGDTRVAVERARTQRSDAAIGPGTGGRQVPEARTMMVDVWQRASRQLAAVCREHDIRYYHFLQPNQYVPDSKPIGAEEAKVALAADYFGRAAVRHAFPLLRQAGQRLRADGVAFTDLTMVFADVDEPLYTDSCCHFGRDGHRIVAAHVAATMRRDIDLGGVEWAGMRVEPAAVQLASPMQRQPVRVFGIDAGGGEHDLSGAGFGTAFVASPADVVAVAADGSLRALRRGACTLRVTRETVEAEVEVRASWPDLLEADDGVRAASGELPRIEVDERALAAGEARFVVQCTNLPTSAYRFFLVASKPPPATPAGNAMFGARVVPMSNEGTSQRVPVDVTAPAGQPMFLRFYALEQTATKVVSASPTIVITRG